MLPFDFRCVTETYGLCINIYFFWFFGMSWNFTNCLMIDAKHLTRTKERSHVIKQRSPNEIRVWQLVYWIEYGTHIACLICLLEAWKVRENDLCFLCSLENAMNSLCEHAAPSEFINTHCIQALSEELATRAYRAKRVHPLRMNTHPLAELLVAKRSWIAKPR